MDYFKILNLDKEPFSNSPDPDFFFQSTQHRECLQKIELAIRLRRGLNVVMGDVGTGKTTLCRQLIGSVFSSAEDKQEVETHLILDPFFSNSVEFLSAVTMMFGLSAADAAVESEWQLKENIKNYLFKKGVDEQKIIVLIIDEGQKLPDFSVEILREFLNYETNEFKLLQIVIFAQQEFKRIIKDHGSFADRVNRYNYLKPLNLRETKAMIEFRLARASNRGVAPPLFTYLGLWAVWMATGGYPRKVISLCHQIVLSLIIQNRIKAGYFLVRSCARRASADRPKTARWIMAATAVILLTALFVTELISHRTVVLNPITVASKVGRQSEENPSRGPVAMLPGEMPRVKKIPETLGQLPVGKKMTVLKMLKQIYGEIDFRQLESIARLNPHIDNLNLIKTGQALNIPAFPLKSSPFSQGSGAYRVQVASYGNLREAYDFIKAYSPRMPEARIFPYWNNREGMVFAVIMKNGFATETSALAAARQLSPSLASGARVVNKWDENTVFFCRIDRH